MSVDDNLDSLAEPFAGKIRLLQARILRDGLPFRPFEARRSFSRQHALYMTGRAVMPDGSIKKVGGTVTNAKAGQSPHQWGLAVDFVLDLNSDWWSKAPKNERPSSAWDAGSDDRPLPKLAWERFGRVVKECGLVWGGSWASFKDLPHVEPLDWKTLRPANWLEVSAEEVRAGR